jgi:hypothetical protein
VALTVVYLKKGEQPPAASKKTMVLDCKPGTTSADFEKTLSDLADKGVTRVFVRGKPSA